MTEIALTVERDDESGWRVASSNDPGGKDGITTQGHDLRELQEMVKEAVLCHSENGQSPQTIRLHVSTDAVLATA